MQLFSKISWQIPRFLPLLLGFLFSFFLSPSPFPLASMYVSEVSRFHSPPASTTAKKVNLLQGQSQGKNVVAVVGNWGWVGDI